MFDLIAKPFGIILLWFYNLVGNYGVAIFLFSLVVKIILLPFQMKSKKSMMRMAALNPQIEELKRRHEGNQQRLQQEMARLYKEEKVSPMSGCLWGLLPFPILLALYRAIRFPLTTMMGIEAALVNEGGAIYEKLAELGFDFSGSAAYLQLRESEFITNNFSAFAGITDKLVDINYRFLGLNLADTPSVTFWSNGVTWASFGLFLIPLVAAGLSFLQSKISMETNPTAADQQAQQSNKTMMYLFPLLSLWIGFSMPASMGLYWIFTSLLALVQEIILNKVYGKQLAAARAESEAKVKAREAELERKRQETERLRMEGLTKENENTSRKKSAQRRAAALQAEEEEKKANKNGGKKKQQEKPASQVGDRRYARGRAYVPDRFTNPARAAEATAAAAAESAAAEAEELAESVEELPVEPVSGPVPAEAVPAETAPELTPAAPTEAETEEPAPAPQKWTWNAAAGIPEEAPKAQPEPEEEEAPPAPKWTWGGVVERAHANEAEEEEYDPYSAPEEDEDPSDDRK